MKKSSKIMMLQNHNKNQKKFPYEEQYHYDNSYQKPLGWAYGTFGMNDFSEHTKKNKRKMRKMDKQMAQEWLDSMENEDGSIGAHWSLEQTKQVASQKDIDCDPIEFWVAMNMIYSDYYLVAKKFNMNTPDFYVEMAKAFLDDKDVQDNKLENYFSYVVK